MTVKVFEDLPGCCRDCEYAKFDERYGLYNCKVNVYIPIKKQQCSKQKKKK